MRFAGMPWQPPRSDRTKSVALVALLHLAIGAGLIIGLAGEPLRQVSDAITTFDVPPPPPQPAPEPRQKEQPAQKDAASAPNLAAKPASVVLPPPPIKLPVPSPLPTAQQSAPVTGTSPSAGASAIPGPGQGANGSGTGTGGGGSGEGTGAGGLGSEARLLSGNLTRRDYRQIRGFGAPSGQAVLAIEVDATGRISRCQPFASSGNPALDATLCELLSRTRWAPALDRSGRPIPVALRYVATWDRD